MTKKVLKDAVTRADDDSWTFQCPGVDQSACGDPNTGQPFHSSGWPTARVAEARGQQHLDEHTNLRSMPDLDEFRAEHGLVPHDDGVRAVQGD